MECQIQISVKVGRRLQKQLGKGGLVDIQQVTQAMDEDIKNMRIIVYHKLFMKTVEDFFGEGTTINWMHNDKPLLTTLETFI